MNINSAIVRSAAKYTALNKVENVKAVERLKTEKVVESNKQESTKVNISAEAKKALANYEEGVRDNNATTAYKSGVTP